MDSPPKKRIVNTFNSIADRYTLANHLLSLGQDVYWRKVLCQHIYRNLKKKEVMVDVATGTGESFKYCFEDFRERIGIDPARKMIEIGKKRFPDIFFIEGMAEDLPFKDSSVDLVTVSFGVRNFADRKEAFREFSRVLKRDGIVAILEFFPMENGSLINKAVSTYIYKILPYLGGMITGNFSAYKYLAKSIKNFILPEVMKLELKSSQFEVVENHKIFPNVYVILGRKV